MANCECAVCKNNLPFEIPNEIIDALVNEQLVIFAGAGISTESKLIFKETLYEDVAFDLDLEPEEELSFPKLMSLFCNQKNGRQKLLEKIKERFDYCQKFTE